MRTSTALNDERRPHPAGDEPSGPPTVNHHRDWRARGCERRQRLIELNDVFHAVTFVAAEILARAVPERHWRAVARAVARASLAVRRRQTVRDTELLSAYLTGHTPDHLDRRALVGSIIAASFEERVFFRKAAHDPAWRPDVRLEGQEQLEAALAAGRGAVLWVAPMIFATLLVKIALHDAGYRVAHLSVQWHGPARTRFGRWLVNARAVAVEERFVERIVIPAGGRAGAVLEELGRRLRRNRVVTITAVGNANRPVEAPFLGRRLRLGPGAPRLALAHRASLLAAITARNEAGGFRVMLQPLPADGDGRDRNATECLAHAFSEAYARGVVENFALWNVRTASRVG